MTLTRTREDDVDFDCASDCGRAGFGATPDELDAAVEMGYDATLEKIAESS